MSLAVQEGGSTGDRRTFEIEVEGRRGVSFAIHVSGSLAAVWGAQSGRDLNLSDVKLLAEAIVAAKGADAAPSYFFSTFNTREVPLEEVARSIRDRTAHDLFAREPPT